MSTPDSRGEDLMHDAWIEEWTEANYRHLREVFEPEPGIDAFLDELEAVVPPPWRDAEPDVVDVGEVPPLAS